MRALLDGMPGHSFLKDRDGRYLAANQMFCRMLGKREEEIIGTTDMDLFPPDLALKRMADDQQVLGAEIPLLETEDLIGQGQNQAWMLTRKIPVPAVDGTVARLIGVSIDITARKAMEEALRTAARTDKLTGLPNRTMLCDRVQQAVLRSRLVPDYHFAVLFLDFDRFKTINDSLGHDVGDQLLQEIANRLRTIVRAGDSLSRLGGEHITARLGGDEFVVLLDDIAVPDDAALVADRLLLAFAQPYELGPHRVFSTASIGIVTSNLPFECAEDILRDADTAMYEAKMAGKNQYVLFDAAMRQRVQNRLTLENDLHKAVDAGQLFLMYEPIVSLQTGQIESFEALVRWRHPERGRDFTGRVYPHRRGYRPDHHHWGVGVARGVQAICAVALDHGAGRPADHQCQSVAQSTGAAGPAAEDSPDSGTDRRGAWVLASGSHRKCDHDQHRRGHGHVTGD